MASGLVRKGRGSKGGQEKVITERSSGLDPFHPLIGEWTVASQKYAEERGRMTAESIEGDGFLRLRDDMFFATTWIIGSDDSAADCWCLYHDARGVRRVYRTSLVEGVWKIWRDDPGFSQQFVGTLAADGQTITAEWQSSVDGSTWETDFDLTYKRVA